jgi:hypothetical protein
MTKCPEGRFANNSEYTHKLNIENNFWCSKDVDFELFGSPSAEKFKLI